MRVCGYQALGTLCLVLSTTFLWAGCATGNESLAQHGGAGGQGGSDASGAAGSGATGASSGAAGAAGGEACPGSTLCGAVCTNTKFDPFNCGMCGTVCEVDEVCSQSKCA